MKAMGFSFVVLVPALLVLSLLFSCAPKATPVPAPATATPTPVATPRATPAPTREPAPGGSAWQAEWEKTLAEARKEGRVVVYGPPGFDVRQALTEGFGKAYPGIQVEYTGATGAMHAAKIRAERTGGLYLIDLLVTGPGDTPLVKDFVVPIEQLLILPEVKEGKYWQGGKLKFVDTKGELHLVFATYLKAAVAHNTHLLPKEKLKAMSYWDLTKPEWKDKIVWIDPRTPGPGVSTAQFLYAHPELGTRLLRALAQNSPVLSRDWRLAAEWVARGKYPLLLGPDTKPVIEFMREGLPINNVAGLREGTNTSPTHGVASRMDKAPHPKAATAYLNWLLGREGQLAWAKATLVASRRVDVPRDFLPPETLPEPGVQYYEDWTEEALKIRPELARFLIEILGK